MQEILGPDSNAVFTAQPEKHHAWINDIDPRYWDVVQRGLEGAVTYGTAKGMKLKYHGVAGKTGTAETSPGKPTHAWVVAYAPTNQPRYALTVFLEHGGSGGGKAAPIAKQILKYLLEKDLDQKNSSKERH